MRRLLEEFKASERHVCELMARSSFPASDSEQTVYHRLRWQPRDEKPLGVNSYLDLPSRSYVGIHTLRSSLIRKSRSCAEVP